jgi:sugar lactone lactonase YvrE
LADGSIYAGDLRTGQGAVLVPAQQGRVAVGLSFDARTGYLFVAGGPGGAGYVYDTASGESVADFQFAAAPTFVNDVVVTRHGAYFTDSFRPVLYFVPLSRRGALPDTSEFIEIPLGGDFQFVPGEFNTNGIVATPNGKSLVIVNSAQGALYRVDPASGVASRIDLGGGSVPNGDGMLLDGRTLYVVQNFLNQISVVRLKRNLSAGTVVDTLTDPDFRIPTTIAEFRDALYAVNARFDVTPTPDTEYEVVRVSIREEGPDSDD